MTLRIGYKLSSEEHDAAALVGNARAAEDAGFALAAIYDHFHPWTDRQGQSPFVWSVLGGIATATERLEVGTLVTCPTVRIHPAIVAHASATVASMAGFDTVILHQAGPDQEPFLRFAADELIPAIGG